MINRTFAIMLYLINMFSLLFDIKSIFLIFNIWSSLEIRPRVYLDITFDGIPKSQSLQITLFARSMLSPISCTVSTNTCTCVLQLCWLYKMNNKNLTIVILYFCESKVCHTYSSKLSGFHKNFNELCRRMDKCDLSH